MRLMVPSPRLLWRLSALAKGLSTCVPGTVSANSKERTLTPPRRVESRPAPSPHTPGVQKRDLGPNSLWFRPGRANQAYLHVICMHFV